MLIFPAEAAHAGLSRRFKNWDKHRFTMNPIVADFRLVGSNGEQRLVIDCLDKSISQRIEYRPQSADVL